jgi:sarcosine oxidase subunit delta
MGFQINCPNCGFRDVYEFKFGGEAKERPGPDADIREWRHYIYFNKNANGIHEEWWYHTFGCRTWIKITRNTATHQIIQGEGK